MPSLWILLYLLLSNLSIFEILYNDDFNSNVRGNNEKNNYVCLYVELE